LRCMYVIKPTIKTIDCLGNVEAIVLINILILMI
jgi:hypothetical protein